MSMATAFSGVTLRLFTSYKRMKNYMRPISHKLRAEHLSFKKNIMKVKLATQIFSRSVAIALLFRKTTLKLRQFDQIEGTAKTLLILNDLFDILDSKVHGYGIKRALNLENADNIIAR